jgi:uncharacterized protein (DUF488 family)
VEKVIYTIGYEASDLNDFLTTLKNAGVQIVLDIRALPHSRRAGFSKTPLSNALKEKGIEYTHLRGLGNPQKLGAPPAGDFHESFTAHMQTDAAQSDLRKAVDIASEKPACLLCYERKPEECHRTIVVKHVIERTGQKIENLFIEKGGAVQLGFI